MPLLGAELVAVAEVAEDKFTAGAGVPFLIGLGAHLAKGTDTAVRIEATFYAVTMVPHGLKKCVEVPLHEFFHLHNYSSFLLSIRRHFTLQNFTQNEFLQHLYKEYILSIY